MRYLYTFIFLLLHLLGINAQTERVPFPNDFFGTYVGNLQIDSEKGNQTIPMEFHLLPTDSIGTYAYRLIYGEGDAKQVRNYTLLEKDKKSGWYLVDEHNGILLDDKVLNNRMYALFEVNETILTTFITFEKEYMIFEIVASTKGNKRVTYAEDKSETKVISYPISTVQRAVLKKL